MLTGPKGLEGRRESSQGQQSLFLDLNEKTGSWVPTSQRLPSRWQEQELGLVLWAIAHTSGARDGVGSGGAQRHLAGRCEKVCSLG